MALPVPHRELPEKVVADAPAHHRETQRKSAEKADGGVVAVDRQVFARQHGAGR
jgi:hypothetical protein